MTGKRRPPVLGVGLGVLQAAAVLHAVLDAAVLIGGRHGDEVATNLGYLIALLAVLPLTATAVHGEAGRWANAAFAVGCLVLVVVSMRLSQTLGAPRG